MFSTIKLKKYMIFGFALTLTLGCGQQKTLKGYSGAITVQGAAGLEAYGKLTGFDAQQNLTGMVCQGNSATSVKVFVYTVSEAGASELAVEIIANQPSDIFDNEVSNQCSKIGTIYKVLVPYTNLQTKAGQKIWVTIKSIKNPSQYIPLAKSGEFTVPSVQPVNSAPSSGSAGAAGSTPAPAQPATPAPSEPASSNTSSGTPSNLVPVASGSTGTPASSGGGSSNLLPVVDSGAIYPPASPSGTPPPPLAPAPSSAPTPPAPSMTPVAAPVASVTPAAPAPAVVNAQVMRNLKVKNGDPAAIVNYGSTSCSGDCNSSYNNGTQVVLRALGAAGWLSLWSGCNSVNGNTCTVTLNSDREVSVEYILPIYRRKNPNNGDWLYSTNVNEAKATYTQGGIVVFYLYSAPKPGRSLLYRCLRSTTKGPDHFLSQSPNCENQKYEGPLGYVSNAPEGTGSLLLKRYYHPVFANHFTQAGSQVVPGPGFRLEGPQGYVPR